MDLSTARAVLEAAVQGSYLDAVPESDEEVLSQGQYFYDEAVKAKGAGMNDAAVERIIEVGGAEGGTVAEERGEPEGEVGSPAVQEDDGVVSEDAAPDGDAVGEAERAPESSSENLPIPPEIEGEVMEMPRDLTTLSDREIRRLHGEYNALLARATYLVSVEAGDLNSAMALYDHAVRKAFFDLPDKDDEGKRITKADRMEEARLNEEASGWIARVSEHTAALDKLKALKEIYKGHVDRLSRDWTMRTEEFERSGGKR